MNVIKFNKLLTVSALVIGCHSLSAQQNYDDFEGSSIVCYSVAKIGNIDTLADNPAPNKINSSPKCARYVRSGSDRFDNVKMCLRGKLGDVNKFASYSNAPEKIKMKVYTTAPVGTLIEIQFGKKGGLPFPDGTHSQYQAVTKASGQWEEIEFVFSQIPQGSKISVEEVDQIILLFSPNSSSDHIYYFDDITGPHVITAASDSGSERNSNGTSPVKVKPADKQ